SLVREYLKRDEGCYSDPNYMTLTFDVSFYLNKFYSQGMTAKKFYEWAPHDYSPKITVDKWVELLQNPDVFTEKAKTIVARIKAHDGQANCTQLSEEYGEEVNFYNSGSVALARRVAEATGCEPYKKASGDIKWWPILYVGKPADKDEAGTYIWKLRKELSEAMDQVDLTVSNDTRYWWLNASPRIWSFSNIEVGKTQSYTMYNENGNKRRVFQNFLDAQIGDQVIGYESNPMKKIVALCEVSAKDDETIQFKKLENLVSPIDYSTLKETPELEEMEFFQNPNGTLFALTSDEYGVIMDAIREENPLPEKKSYEKYDREKFLDEVFMGSDLSNPSDSDAAAKRYEDLAGLVNDKWNVILTGAPGVGKTFAAKRLAYSLMGEENDDRIEMVQFHQNYSYEDFVLGYKPNKNGGFNLKDGVFYRFCQKASNDRENKYFFIIDEINRGNMSRIFGELLMMIEKDYRGKEMRLAYEDRTLIVPGNIRIIGMMNTADRSLAMIDYALRRRFSFFEMEPAFNSEGFKKYQRETVNDTTFDKLIDKIVELNKEIETDSTLGKGFCIGHSYFSEWKKEDCADKDILFSKMRRVVKYDIIPMLEEYWFDEPNKVREEENKLLRVVKLPEVPES
ncbi:MAG: EVE domain-containing protein, partial [Clostridia bacterium]|nr:EVE domain-containing protein [Clostridia bacterium]